MTSPRLPYLLTAALLVAAVVVVFVAVYTAKSECDNGACEPPELALPTSNLRYANGGTSDRPPTTVALFVDLSSHASRRLFTTAVRTIDNGELNAAELVLYHAPPDECTDEPSSYSCQAARAVECAEEQRTGAGVRLAALALDRLWLPPPALDLGGLLEAAQGLRLDASALSICTDPDHRPEIAEKIRAQSSWARSKGLQRAPGGFIVRRAPSVMADVQVEVEDDVNAPIERVAPFDTGVTRIELHRLWRCTGEATTASCDDNGGAQ